MRKCKREICAYIYRERESKSKCESQYGCKKKSASESASECECECDYEGNSERECENTLEVTLANLSERKRADNAVSMRLRRPGNESNRFELARSTLRPAREH